MSVCAGSYPEPFEEVKKKPNSEIATFPKGGILTLS